MVKKLMLAAVSGFVGLGLTIAPANAADDPYVASVATHCDSSPSAQTVKRGNSFVTNVEVRANSNRTPKGSVKLTYDRIAGGFHATKSAAYPGHAVDVTSPVLDQLGRYKVTTSFTPTDGSRFRACSSSFTVNVRKGLGPNEDDDDDGTGPDDDGNGILPDTGGPDLLWLLLALGLVGSGAGLVYIDRRRRQTAAQAV